MLLPARLSLQLHDMWAPLQPLVNSTVGLTSSDQLHDIVFERFDWPGEHLQDFYIMVTIPVLTPLGLCLSASMSGPWPNQ